MRVVPDVPAIHRQFDYSVPERLAPQIAVGARVRVELHGRRVGGWVVEDDVGPTPGVSPKPIAASSGAGPPPSVVALAQWAAWRWAGPVSSFLGTASPNRVVRPDPRGTGGSGGSGAPSGAPSDSVSGRASGRASDGPRPPSPGGGSVAIVDDVLAEAVDSSVVRLAPALDATLVVFELIHRMGPASVLVLAPSHGRAEQVATRLAAAGLPVALLPDMWEEAATGSRVVVGTRVAAWAPLGRLRAAVVLDAHDEAYREERSPTWSAVDVVVERGRRDRGPVVLISPCPPLALTHGHRLVTTARALERRGWPVVEVIDRTGDDPRTGLFSERLVHAVRSGAGATRGSGGVHPQPDRSHPATGLCPLRHSGPLHPLRRAMVQDEAAGGLHCRRCGDSRPAVCAVCDSTSLKSLRIGVTRAVRGALGPDRGRRHGDHRQHGARAMALTPGWWSVPRPPCTGSAGPGSWPSSISTSICWPRGLAPARRRWPCWPGRPGWSARAIGGGRVLVQTRIPDHEALLAAARADPDLLARAGSPVAGGARAYPRSGPWPCCGAREPPPSPSGCGTVGDRGPCPRWTSTAGWPGHPTMPSCAMRWPPCRVPPSRLRVEVDPTDT